ncbi:hypothetical protein B0H19DRAFT_1062786 [Mycena capillaripes]|nr:hypothetical protein B0H19DRAFT_1062786 [Mycena capillaripes]
MAHMFFAVTGITNRQTEDLLNRQSVNAQGGYSESWGGSECKVSDGWQTTDSTLLRGSAYREKKNWHEHKERKKKVKKNTADGMRGRGEKKPKTEEWPGTEMVKRIPLPLVVEEARANEVESMLRLSGWNVMEEASTPFTWTDIVRERVENRGTSKVDP